jgi:threonine dehydrogenase-like Zn-dependent dehydrogenase
MSMPEWLLKFLGKAYERTPAAVRPAAKQTFLWSALRLEGAATRRKVVRGHRIEFLGFEIAHLEPYEFLGPAPNEVQVRALASCVSPGTERAVLCGLPGARRQFPYAPGYSTAGIVEKVGGKVPGVKPGDLVAGRMPHANRGILTRGSLFRVPRGVSPQAASFLELGIITLQGMRKANIRPGNRIAVVGQGLIGQLATRMARLVGGDPIIAVATSRRRAKSAVSPAGATEFVATSEHPDAVRRIEADIVIEAVGSAQAIVLAMDAARHGGTVVLLGSSRDLGRDLDWFRIAQERKLTLVGAHIGALPARDASPGRWTYEQEGRLFLELLAAGRLDISDLVTWRPSPSECNQVYEVLAAGGREHVGIVFDWQQWSEPPEAAHERGQRAEQ